jgi:CheY-like chemotaxis protein
MPGLARDSIRILHVDDDAEFAKLSARGLQRAGFTQPVTHYPDGRLALDYFSMVDRASAPHVILLDLHMPGMNGLEVLRWLRENYSERDVAVYLLTSSEDPAHQEQAAAYGVTEYLLKSPFADHLIEKLDGLIMLANRRELPTAREKKDAPAGPAPEGLTSFSPDPA